MAETKRSVSTQLSEMSGYLGRGTKVTGKLEFPETVNIEGEVEGEVLVHGNAIIGEQATIRGKVIATSVLIRGNVTADIQADEKIEIQPPGVILGDIATQHLVIGEGAIFEGYCSMKKEQKEGSKGKMFEEDPTRAISPPQTGEQSFDP
ncbi:MAG: polymer-forming cytoskeletal protein [Candidatus Binatia bacterium]